MHITKPTFAHHPVLLGDQPETPDQEQYDSAREDAKEDEGDTTSALDAELDASTGEEMDAQGINTTWHRPIGVAEGIMLCKGSEIKHIGNFANLGIDD